MIHFSPGKGCQRFTVLQFSPIFSTIFVRFCGFKISVRFAFSCRNPVRLSVFGYFELWFCGFDWWKTFKELFCGLINANTSQYPLFLPFQSQHAFFGHKACWLLAIFFSCSFAAFAKISCGDAVSGTPLTPPVGGDGFFHPRKEYFVITRREVSLDFDLEN